MASNEFDLGELLEHPLGADAEVDVLGDEEPELVRQVEVGLVVRRGREQDAFAVVSVNVLLNRAVALAFAIAKVVALVDEHDAVAAQVRQFALIA